jgi:hypothetical protein
MQMPAWNRIVVRSLVALSLLLLFAGVPSALVFLKVFGFGETIRDRVAGALSNGPVETRIGRLSFDLIDGLVAENVALFQRGGGPRKLAGIDRIAVVPNLSELLSGRVVIDRIALDDADAQIPVGESGSLFRIGGLHADLQFVGDRMQIVSFEAVLQGIRIGVSGSLDGMRSATIGGGGEEDHPERVRRLLNFLEGVSFAGRPPRVTVRIAGSLADPESLALDPIAVSGGPVEGSGWRFEGIEARGSYANGHARVEHCVLRDATGQLQLWATGDARAAEIQIDSSLAPSSFAGLIPEAVPQDQFSLTKPPGILARVSLRFDRPKPAVSASGSIRLSAFSLRGVPCDALKADFAYDNGRFFLRGGDLRSAGGRVSFDALHTDGGLRLKARGMMMPALFTPALDAKTRAMLADMEFADMPWMQVHLRGPGLDFRQMRGHGDLHLGRTAMRGVWIDSIKSAFDVADGAITYRDFALASGKSRGTGTFTYDFANQLVRLEDIASTMNPVDVMMWVDPRIAETLRPYRFRANPTVRGGGTIFMKDLAKNNLSLDVESAEGLDYDLFGKTLRLGKTSAKIDVVGPWVNANIRRAALMDGQVAVKARVSIDPANPVFGADVTLERVNFAKLTKLYFDYEGSQGVGSGSFSFKAPLRRPSSMVGSGSIRVEDGNVFAIPLLGPLSVIISKIVPGTGYETARLATADFDVADERIQTKNLAIEGAGFSLLGQGDIYFLTEQMDMSVRINARGMPGIVLFPVSKLFEYVSTGTVSNPDWRPKIIPRIGPFQSP